jgi:hypothetical protein
MVYRNYAFAVVSSLSAALGTSGSPIQDELLMVHCKSEAERFRGKYRLSGKIPLSLFSGQLVQLCRRAKRAAK